MFRVGTRPAGYDVMCPADDDCVVRQCQIGIKS